MDVNFLITLVPGLMFGNEAGAYPRGALPVFLGTLDLAGKAGKEHTL
jgi:hypothetical protein